MKGKFDFDIATIGLGELSHVLDQPYGNPNRRYWRKTLKIRMKIGMKLLKCPFMYNAFLRKLVLKSGLQSIKIDKVSK